jgi:hypothetical protein
MQSTLRHASALAAAVALFTLVSTAPAHAAADGPNFSITGSTAWFTHDGDVAWVKDTKADGHSAVVRVYVPDVGIAENLFNPDGTGTSRNRSYGTRIPEGTTVYYQPCTGENSTKTLVACADGWAHGTA